MRLLTSPVPARLRFALGFCALVLFAGCDGSSRIENYVPTKIVSFGDELSTIVASTTANVANARKYTINGINSTTNAVDCTLNPIWNQSLASNFGLAFPECPGANGAPNGVMAAAAGARVANVMNQVATHGRADFVPSTLVSLQGGMWDVLDSYGQVKAGTQTLAGALSAVRAAGTQLGQTVNQITANGSGARVIYETVPELGLSPLAYSDQAAAAPCAGRTCNQLLKDLIFAFNESMRLAVINDGRYAATSLPSFDDTVRSMANPTFSVGTYLLLNTTTALTEAACTVIDLSNCTLATSTAVATLVPAAAGAASPSTAYLWASDRLPGPNWHGRVANVAIARARNNPF